MTQGQADKSILRSIAINVVSASGKQYTISRADDGSFWCSCPAWKVSARQAGRDAAHRRCKHMDALTHDLAQHFVDAGQYARP